MAWLGSVFNLKKEATIPIFHFKKEKTKTKKRIFKQKNVWKKFPLYINIDSKCLSIHI